MMSFLSRRLFANFLGLVLVLVPVASHAAPPVLVKAATPVIAAERTELLRILETYIVTENTIREALQKLTALPEAARSRELAKSADRSARLLALRSFVISADTKKAFTELAKKTKAVRKEMQHAEQLTIEPLRTIETLKTRIATEAEGRKKATKEKISKRKDAASYAKKLTHAEQELAIARKNLETLQADIVNGAITKEAYKTRREEIKRHVNAAYQDFKDIAAKKK